MCSVEIRKSQLEVILHDWCSRALTFDNFCRVHQGGRGDADVLTEILEIQLSKREFVERGKKIENFFCSFKSRISGKNKNILERQPVTSRLMTRTRKSAQNARTHTRKHTRKHTHTHTRIEVRHPNNQQLVFQFESWFTTKWTREV